MKNKAPLSVYIVSALLLLFVILVSVNAPLWLINSIFFISPFLLVWMVLSVLKSKTFTGNDLEEDEEWGYADKQKEDLGTF